MNFRSIGGFGNSRTIAGVLHYSWAIGASLYFWHWLLADIDECASPSLNSCASNATCTNTPGAYNCSCNAGFKGDGFVKGSRCTASATLTPATNSNVAIIAGRIAHQQSTVTFNLISNVCKFIHQSRTSSCDSNGLNYKRFKMNDLDGHILW